MRPAHFIMIAVNLVWFLLMYATYGWSEILVPMMALPVFISIKFTLLMWWRGY